MFPLPELTKADVPPWLRRKVVADDLDGLLFGGDVVAGNSARDATRACPVPRAPRLNPGKRFPIFIDVGGASRWYITLTADILPRGVPEPAVGAINQEASERGVAPGEFITRVITFYLLLSGPGVPAQVVAARRDCELQSDQT
jgi:hypothetical protein